MVNLYAENGGIGRTMKQHREKEQRGSRGGTDDE